MDANILAPSPPAITTSPSLTANLVCRLLLAIVANTICLVPLRLLYRNGELAAVVFILNIEFKNLETIVSALLWRDDDVSAWWPGYGLCDVDAYFHNASIGLFVTCLLAMMRNLAGQVGLLRANALTVQEKRRRNLVQALIIFPFPLLQVAMTWPLTAQRYLVGTLMGCSWIPHPSWPYLLVFVLPPPIFALLTACYAGMSPTHNFPILCYSFFVNVSGLLLTGFPIRVVLTYQRFREVTKTTQSALMSSRVAHQRSQRTRRRLYMMVISILVPFLPIVMALSIMNILEMHGLKAYSYDEVHHHARPVPWDTIMFFTSAQINWTYMNNCYIPIATALPIFIFFGMTKDAINQYRVVGLFFGLGRLFPGLKDQYDPDRALQAGQFTSSTDSNPSCQLETLKRSVMSTAE